MSINRVQFEHGERTMIRQLAYKNAVNLITTLFLFPTIFPYFHFHFFTLILFLFLLLFFWTLFFVIHFCFTESIPINNNNNTKTVAPMHCFQMIIVARKYLGIFTFMWPFDLQIRLAYQLQYVMLFMNYIFNWKKIKTTATVSLNVYASALKNL